MQPFILRLFLFSFIFFGTMHAAVWLYESPQRLAIKNGTHDKFNKWNEIRDTDQSFNTIILGSSRGDSAYNPEIIDSLANTTTYNMSTGSQHIIETYYILQEVLKFQKPAVVIYETFLPSFRNNEDYYHIIANANLMSSQGKYDMLLNGYGSKGVINLVLPVLKYKTYVKNDLRKWINEEHINDSSSTYRIKGYYYNDQVVDESAIAMFRPIYDFQNTDVNKEFIERYTEQLIELCSENNIKLICVRAPYPPSRFKKSNFDEVHHYFSEFYKGKNIPFYDFNYLSEDIIKDSDFSDYNHLNYMGARKVSIKLAEIIKAQFL